MSYFGFPDRYPPAVYTDDAGGVSATFRPTDTPPDVLYPNGGTCEYLRTGAQAEGRFGLYRWTFGEAESGANVHYHRAISEHFYILEGTVRLHDGGKWVNANPGDYLYVPAGGLHGFKGADHAKMLVGFAPGGPREGYFEMLASGGLAAMTDEERNEFMDWHDQYYPAEPIGEDS